MKSRFNFDILYSLFYVKNGLKYRLSDFQIDSHQQQGNQDQSDNDPVPAKYFESVFLQESDKGFDCYQGHKKCNDVAKN